MKKLKEHRSDRGWSQNTLATEAGLHPATVSQIENGILVPYPKQALKISEAFGIPQDEIEELSGPLSLQGS